MKNLCFYCCALSEWINFHVLLTRRVLGIVKRLSVYKNLLKVSTSLMNAFTKIENNTPWKNSKKRQNEKINNWRWIIPQKICFSNIEKWDSDNGLKYSENAFHCWKARIKTSVKHQRNTRSIILRDVIRKQGKKIKRRKRNEN